MHAHTYVCTHIEYNKKGGKKSKGKAAGGQQIIKYTNALLAALTGWKASTQRELNRTGWKKVLECSYGLVPNVIMPITSQRNKALANEINTHGWKIIVLIFGSSEALLFKFIFF